MHLQGLFANNKLVLIM